MQNQSEQYKSRRYFQNFISKLIQMEFAHLHIYTHVLHFQTDDYAI